MNKPTKEYPGQFVDILRELHDFMSEYLQKYHQDPTRSSFIQKELGEFPREMSVMSAYYQGTILLDAVGDHIYAFVKTLSEEVQTISPYVCIRALLEASALLCYQPNYG